MKTRIQYLNKECSHREYYSQFVNQSTINGVKSSIGLDKIINSDCNHFNDIHLVKWDNCSIYISKDLLSEVGENYTLSTKVCIAKEAAKQIKETFKT